jgi:hypothetical protein
VVVPTTASSGQLTVTTPGGTSTGIALRVVLGTRTASSLASVQLFPNPAQQAVRLQVPGVAGATQVQATVLNALGKVVRTHTAALPASGTSLLLDVAGLARGVYQVRLLAGSATGTQRLLLD